jgi:hypothetical protein
MPAKAGIQGESARAFGFASWIPGLAGLARNDVPAGYSLSLLWWSMSGCCFVTEREKCSTALTSTWFSQSSFEKTSALACEAHPSSYGAAIRPNARKCLNFHVPLILI